MVISSAVRILLEIEEESVIVIWAGTIHCCPRFPLPYSDGDLLCVWSFDETMSAACVQLLCNLKRQFQNKSMTCHNFQTTRHFLHRSVTKESAVTQESANIQWISIHRKFEVIRTACAAAFSPRWTVPQTITGVLGFYLPWDLVTRWGWNQVCQHLLSFIFDVSVHFVSVLFFNPPH